MFKQSFRLSKTDFILLAFYFIPFVIVIGYITQFGVNIPVYDQWVLPKLFEKVATNQLYFRDLFELHNNHRILFPRLIFIALAFLSDWNIKLEMFFSLGLAVLTFIAIYILASITSSPKDRNLFHVANLLTGCLIFSLNQEWLWGFQLPIFLINFCLILACLVLSLKCLNSKNKLILAAIFCFVASFSSVQGLITWLAVIPLILSQDEPQISKKKQLLIWLTGFILSGGIYAIGYQQEPRIIDLSFTEYLLTAIQFFLNLLAAPIVKIPILSTLIGAIIFVLFIGILIYCLKTYSLNLTSPPTPLYPPCPPLKGGLGEGSHKIEESLITLPITKNSYNQFAPWLSIGLFSLLTSLLMTWGRVEFGGNYPLTATRYTTHTLLLIVSLVQLCRLLITHSKKIWDFNRENRILIYSFFGGILLSLIAVSSQTAITQAKLELPNKQSSQTCFNLFYYLEDSDFFKISPDRCLLPMSKSTWWIRDGVESLNNIQMRSFAENIPFISQPHQVHGYIDQPSTPLKLKVNQILRIGGWAILPDQTQQPRLVFLSFGEQNSFFANADIIGESPDIAEFLNSQRYGLARWEVMFSAESLPIGETKISAWVYDPQQQQFVRLQGEVKLSIATE
ncbi:hypothetical protein [Limnoraphis robusta]|uniref:Glycosyltransferase RgtA/B/C/D-like domain-containing protein n=1 Tax=Limnoraphis robusta CCNP1315 TaxID=3110306 RepID=A0ABU5TTV8_9CYAN|nr:hypothetical protein [Limnoraphis robusta]MEA5518321.1 hypothetical protein [Limnoraphis robusta CCNP1315]MEA5547702.1 hypothetical protein [Limnoraphis robusta CCNP1324]